MNFNLDKLHVLKYILYLGLFAFPLFSIAITNTLFILFSILVLVIYYYEKPKFYFTDFKFYVILSLPFIPYLLEYLLHSTNSVIKFELEKKILFLIAPFIFYIHSMLQKKYNTNNAVWSFVISVFMVSLTSLLALLYKGKLFDAMAYQNGAYEIRYVFESFSGLHPTYYGLFSSVASLWVMYYLNSFDGKHKIGLIIMLVVLVLVNFIIASKMPLLILFVGIIWIVFKQINSVALKIKLLVAIITSAIFLSVLFPSTRGRLMEIYNYYNHPLATNTISERDMVFNCNKSIFTKNYITGVGARNAQIAINELYVKNQFKKGTELHFNSHNQFLTLGINYGIGVLMLFIGTLTILFFKYKKNTIALLFLLSSIICMFTESILERQMGIYFFLFFSLLFLRTTINSHKENTI